MRQFTKKQFVDILKYNGYWRVRQNGSHCMYKNAEGNVISVPQSHKSVVLLRLIKENNLDEHES